MYLLDHFSFISTLTMKRVCPLCSELKSNLWDHLTRIHNMEGDVRRKWIDFEKSNRGKNIINNDFKATQERKDQRLSPTTKPAEQCDRFQLLHPFTALVAGMTGSGKTVWVQSLLQHKNDVIKPPPQRIVWSNGSLPMTQ